MGGGSYDAETIHFLVVLKFNRNRRKAFSCNIIYVGPFIWRQRAPVACRTGSKQILIRLKIYNLKRREWKRTEKLWFNANTLRDNLQDPTTSIHSLIFHHNNTINFNKAHEISSNIKIIENRRIRQFVSWSRQHYFFIFTH